MDVLQTAGPQPVSRAVSGPQSVFRLSLVPDLGSMGE